MDIDSAQDYISTYSEMPGELKAKEEDPSKKMDRLRKEGLL